MYVFDPKKHADEGKLRDAERYNGQHHGESSHGEEV
jgi:hypothetical protein